MKIANGFLIAGAVVALTACTTVRPMALQDGSMGYALECNGMLETVDQCYAHISSFCPEGSHIVAESASSLRTFDPLVRTLYVQCSKPAG